MVDRLISAYTGLGIGCVNLVPEAEDIGRKETIWTNNKIRII